MAIIWPCTDSASSYAAAGRAVVVPHQRCPSCSRRLVGWGGYWRWLRAPLLIERIWIRRARCPICRRSHALLPDLVLARRLDVVAVIGQAIARKLAGGVGLRPIAEQLGVPHTTLRTWWRRFRARSPTLLSRCTVLAVALDGTAVDVHPPAEGAALEALSIAWLRAQRRFGADVGGLWAFWTRISSGDGLGTNTTSPWAARAGADWMAASASGGANP